MGSTALDTLLSFYQGVSSRRVRAGMLAGSMVTLRDVVLSPGVWFLALVGGVLLAQFLLWRRRNAAFAALAEKYQLRAVSAGSRSDGMAWPNPEISGFFMSAYCQRYLAGHIDGVAVVAFDYLIGGGRGQKKGSGVGVKRAVLDVAAVAGRLGRGLDGKVKDGWTFVYSDPKPLLGSGRRLGTAMLEDLWQQLLRAPGAGGAVALGPEPSRPGEVHIRPRRPRSAHDDGAVMNGAPE